MDELSRASGMSLGMRGKRDTSKQTCEDNGVIFPAPQNADDRMGLTTGESHRKARTGSKGVTEVTVVRLGKEKSKRMRR